MQIREIELTELYLAYQIFKQHIQNLTYKEYEDLIYEMIKENYKIILILDNEKPITYAGIKIETNLSEKKHIHIYEFYTDKNENKRYYDEQMFSYIKEYAKIHMCKSILFSFDITNQEAKDFIDTNNLITTRVLCKQKE